MLLRFPDEDVDCTFVTGAYLKAAIAARPAAQYLVLKTHDVGGLRAAEAAGVTSTPFWLFASHNDLDDKHPNGTKMSQAQIAAYLAHAMKLDEPGIRYVQLVSHLVRAPQEVRPS